MQFERVGYSMALNSATAIAHPNIAFIKYWGNSDDGLRLPVNSSISMNLDGLSAKTSVEWDDDLTADEFTLNNEIQSGDSLHRVSRHLDVLRGRLGRQSKAKVASENNFPTGAGIASSAAAFAALTAAGVAAAGKILSERELSTIARLGSGSAARSIPAGFVEWYAADSHEDSYAQSLFPPDHWNLVDVVAVINKGHKAVGSSAGHPSAQSSPLQNARVAGAEERVTRVRGAIQERNFNELATFVELDSNLMHAVMMTSQPPLFYWEPASLKIMSLIREWRAEGLNVCYTLDAGANVHCICVRSDAPIVSSRLNSLSEVLTTLSANVGGGAHVLP